MIAKELEWNPFHAETGVGYYHIDDQTDRLPEELRGQDPFLLYGTWVNISRYVTLAAAKAAAQADYDRRIRDSLSPSALAAIELHEEMVKALRTVTDALNGRVHSQPALKALTDADALLSRIEAPK